MNYLRLVQELHRESGSGGNAPQSLANLRGEASRLKSWIAQAYAEIQEKHSDWKFLWGQMSIQTVAGTAVYAPLDATGLSTSPNSGIAEFDRDTFFLDGDSIGTENYLDVKTELPETNQGRPWRVVLLPNDTIRLDNVPDGEYTLQFDYWATPHIMNLEDEEPIIPQRFHMAIVAKAMIKYALYENAPEILQQAKEMLAEWMFVLETDQLPGDRYMQRKAEDNVMAISVE